MNGCEVRRGFFVLRDCGGPALNACMECGRSMCGAHTSMSEAMLCIECGARQQESEENDGEDDADWYDDQHTYAYRHDYYSRQNYSPVYAGDSEDSYYDEYDVRSFEERDGDSLEDGDEDEGGGLLDS